jgi:hypothetical protein
MDGLRHQHNGESRWSTVTPLRRHPTSRWNLAQPRAFTARALGEWMARTALCCRFADRFNRPVLPRVDLREGLPVAESSSRAPPFFAALFDRFLDAVLPLPALRSVALTPGLDVSTTSSRRGRRGSLGFGGLASRCCCERNLCALVAMPSTIHEGFSPSRAEAVKGKIISLGNAEVTECRLVFTGIR